MKDSELLKILDNAGKGNATPVVSAPVQQVNYPSNIQTKWIDALAQLETQGGKKSIGDNNLFNIKDNSGKGKTAYDRVEGSRDAYMSYDSPEASKQALLDLLKRKYPQAYNATTAEEFVAGLKGYATDPNHAKKLLGIINKPGMSDSALLSILDKAGSANKLQQPESQTPVEETKVETPKDESVWGKTKDFLLAGPFGMTREINKASPEARTMINESTKTLTAGLYNPKLATEEEIQQSPKSAMAGNVLGYTTYAAIPGGILTQAGVGAAHGGVTSAAEGGTASEVVGSAALGGVLGGAGAAIGKGLSAAAKGIRSGVGSFIERNYPTILSKATQLTGDAAAAGKELSPASKAFNYEQTVAENPSMRPSMYSSKEYSQPLSESTSELVKEAAKKTVGQLGVNAVQNSLIGGAIGAGAASLTGNDASSWAVIGASGGLGAALLKKNLLEGAIKLTVDKAPLALTKLKPESFGNKQDYIYAAMNISNKSGEEAAKQFGKLYDTYQAGVKQFMESPWYKNSAFKITGSTATNVLVPTGQSVKSDIQERTQKNTSPYKLTGQ